MGRLRLECLAYSIYSSNSLRVQV